MTNICLTLCGVLILQMCVNAAPSDLLSKLENIAKVEQNVKPDNEPNPVVLVEETKLDNNATEQGQRQKRFYNYHGYGVPPINPVIYSNYNRDDYSGGFGLEDPFMQIFKRVQDIANAARQPNLPPSLQLPNYFPIFFPVLYIPQIGCGCNPGQNVPPNQNKPTSPPMTQDEGTIPDVDISNRFPEMEDTNQNWGLVIDDPVESDGQPDDFTRPISFVPIKPNRTLIRPPPAVDHGTSQAGGNQGPTMTTTFRPVAANMPQNPPVAESIPKSPPVAASKPQSPPVAANIPQSPPVLALTSCDAAVLSCCHQPEVTYDCFAIQGCDPTSYGNPCEPQVILRVIDRFQRFYGQRSGD